MSLIGNSVDDSHDVCGENVAVSNVITTNHDANIQNDTHRKSIKS